MIMVVMVMVVAMTAGRRLYLVQEPHCHHRIGTIEHFLHLDSHALAGNLQGRKGSARPWLPSHPRASHLGVEPFPHPGVGDGFGQPVVETEL